ncbi:MAG: Rpn family recombination-promoting nuclease/putative transposase, partial [Eubacteriales bacterium]
MKITAWENIGISNNFIFGKVMQNPDICKEFLEMVLGIKIDHIEYPMIEKTMKLSHDSKGIRLDVYVADDKHTVYNIEMQATDTHELPARSRYYQGI